MKKINKTTKNQKFLADMKVLMNKAWSFVRELGMAMADAMKAAWKWFKLRVRMTKEIVEFSYKKIDGSLRIAHGTLIESMLPARKNAAGRPVKVGNMRYYDTDAEGWRSFVIANLVSVA